jgi:multidrug resistance efflux pump
MEKVLQTWLLDQCGMLSGSMRALLLTGPPAEGPYDQARFWPDKGGDHAVLFHVAQATLRYEKPVVKTRSSEVEKTGEPLDTLACPLFLDGRLLGVVAIEMTNRSQPMQAEAIKQIQAGARWLETMIRMQGSTATEHLANLMDLVAAGLDNERFKAAATEVADLLAARFACRRVGLGFLGGNRVRVEALSHTSRIDPHSKRIRAIRDAMSESLDQGATVMYPPPPEAILVTRFHEQLAELNQGAAVCTLPLVKNAKVVGALLLERSPDRPFKKETIEQCEQIGLLIGPVLEARRQDERALPLKMLDALRHFFVALFGPRRLPLKLGAGLTAALLVWLLTATATFRISCESVLEAEICRSIVAPQQGYIAAAHVRAGDLVREGDLMATLDDRELRSEERKWESQRSQILKEYRKALAGQDRAEVAILGAKRAQAEAQLKLIEAQLDRIHLVSPFSGLIVKGDLTQSLGAPVSRGDVLYEVAPTDEYRVVLKVDDRDIGLVSAGQRGQLKLSGIPDRTIPVTVNRLTPVSSAESGRNTFRVEAFMEGHSDLMRPGMKGITKIEVGREKLLWIWTRGLVAWLRLWLWTRLP